MKKKSVILTISLCALLLILNNYVIAQPTQKQLEAFRSAKTVLIVVEKKYEEAKTANLPFESIAQRLFSYAGVNTVSSDSEDYELKLIIEAKAGASGQKYTNSSDIDLGFLYTGAAIAGSINLELPGSPVIKIDFSGYIEPPSGLMNVSPEELRTPAGAPFWWAFIKQDSYLSKVIKMMGEIYGVDFLLSAMKDVEKDVRKYVTIALGNTGDPRAIEPLIFALKDTYLPIRESAVIALGNLGLPEATEHLLSARNDGKLWRSATHALAKIKDSDAIDILLAELKDENPNTRNAIALALQGSKDPRVIEALISALKDDYWRMRSTSAQSLQIITGEKIGKSHKKWKKWWEKNKGKFIKDN